MKDLLIFLAKGFEDIEALTVADYLRRAGLEVDLVSITDHNIVTSAHGVKVVADKTILEINFEDYKGIYIPGGLPGATNLAADERIVEAVGMYLQEDKYVAAICAGPIVLDKAELLKDGNFTCFPGYEENLSVKGRVDEAVVYDGNMITSLGPSFAQVLAFELIKIFKGEEAADEVKKSTLFVDLVDYIKKGKVK
jgi:4-methyl-5(b-hydroxyethyl)-thiazole monophosphate biosynthesis